MQSAASQGHDESLLAKARGTYNPSAGETTPRDYTAGYSPGRQSPSEIFNSGLPVGSSTLFIGWLLQVSGVIPGIAGCPIRRNATSFAKPTASLICPISSYRESGQKAEAVQRQTAARNIPCGGDIELSIRRLLVLWYETHSSRF